MSRIREATAAPRRLTYASLEAGTLQLVARDTDLAGLHTRLGVPPMWGRRPGFATLVLIILEQQVSLAAARTLYRRLRAHLGEMTPEAIHQMGVAGLRAFGLTRQKSGYCFGLAKRILGEDLDLSAVARAPDEAGREALLAVPGLGLWSVGIYYLMALRRPDIWPHGDLALPVALREIKRLDHLPGKDEQIALADAWRPWRSVAARLLWAHYLDARGRALL